ncbi:MAG: hypothetical protein K0S27_1508 [Gammaproteobacteria bacterium]|nr:hypothetical protein [Gammaproteobacteria bacterium]
MIKRISAAFYLLVIALNTAFAITTAPGTSTGVNNFLGPTLNVSLSPLLGQDISSSLGIEGGPRHYRGNATLGWMLAQNHRIKFTGEYLWQKIDYSFYSGVTRQWVNQGAVGANYQYMLFDGVLNDLRLDGYYSYAPSTNLSTLSGTFVSSNTLSYTDQRRIAGSNAAGISPGFDLHPWYGARAVISMNYDNVHYHTHYLPTPHYSGVGGTIDFKQNLSTHLQLNLSAASRIILNNYQAGLSWNQPIESGVLRVGITGEYNKGKHTLPNTSLVALNLNYIFDKTVPLADDDIDDKLPPSLSTWVTEPAVHMPQVLAIADETVTQTSSALCISPSFSGTIPTQGGAPTDLFPSLNTGSFFNGSNLTFSANNLPSSLSIDPATGIITGTFPGTIGSVPVTVTATNMCGLATSNSFNIISG